MNTRRRYRTRGVIIASALMCPPSPFSDEDTYSADPQKAQSLEPPAMTVTGTGIGAAGQEQPARRLLTTTQDISLLILAWLAALLICGMIIWIIAKIEKKLCRLVK